MSEEELRKRQALEDKIQEHKTISIYSRCPDCLTFGVCMPHDWSCGNCGKPNVVRMYDEFAVLKILERESEKEAHE